MPNVPVELLKEAFIDPIRFALLLDDQLPVYPEMAVNGRNQSLNNDLANDLFSFCRRQGWLCDVDNGVAVAERFEHDKHLHQSDLLVLDFHLDSERPNNPSKALRILQSLAGSDHFNLVVVYTGEENIGSVVQDIAYCLGAGKSSDDASGNAREAFEDLGNAAEEVKSSINTAVLGKFLTGDSFGPSAQGIRQSLEGAGVPRPVHTDVINLLCAMHFEGKIDPELITGRPASERKVEASSDFNEGPFWVTAGNVFAAVVNKRVPPSELADRLLQAIEAWSPTPLHVMMVHARAELEKAGSVADRSVLETPRRQAGWMLRILLGETEVERQAQVHQLYERMFEQLTASIKPTLTNFADRIIGPLNEDETAVGKARALAAAGSHVSDGEIYHALNEHVSSDSCRDGPMTTGVVFRATSDGVPQYWVCLTPACDLVPGQNTTGWNGDLHPWRPITVARLTQISAAASVNTAMNNATHGRHIFLHLDSRSVALEVTHQYSRQMNIETILIANEGLIRDGVFEGRTITQDDANGLTLKELQFNVVALLRSDYANKLLAESGQQRARIGVDFFNMPVQPNG